MTGIRAFELQDYQLMSSTPSSRSDRVFALAWLAVCVMIAYKMWQLNVPFAYEPVGPKAFPLILAGLMAVCCVMLLIKPDQDIHWPESAALFKGVFLLVVLIAYGYFFEILGFPLCTTIMSLTVSRIFGGRWITETAIAVVLGVLGFLFFDRVLEVTLPLGRIWS